MSAAAAVVVLCVLACPIGMGLMMIGMGRKHRREGGRNRRRDDGPA